MIVPYKVTERTLLTHLPTAVREQLRRAPSRLFVCQSTNVGTTGQDTRTGQAGPGRWNTGNCQPRLP